MIPSRRTAYRVLLPIALLFIAQPLPNASADDVFTVIVKKQETKKSTRWSLAEWLRTKERMKWMDQWLALHTPSPFEFYVGGAYEGGNPDPGGAYSTARFDAAAYASIFGLQVVREMSPLNHWLGLFNFRLYGYHNQGTNLTLHGGVRSQLGAGGIRNPVVGASMTVYLARFFGIEGLYRWHMKSTASDDGITNKGRRWEAGAFVEYSLLRFYGTWFSTREAWNGLGVATTGFTAGARVYF